MGQVTKKIVLGKEEAEKEKDKKSKKIKINSLNEEKTSIICKEKDVNFTNLMVKKEDSNFTKRMVKKEEAKAADTYPIFKTSTPIGFTLYLKGISKDVAIKTSNNVIIGRLRPEEDKYKDFDFFKIDAPECSRLHAFIYKTNVGYFLSDNNTQNGTYLKVLFIFLKN